MEPELSEDWSITVTRLRRLVPTWYCNIFRCSLQNALKLIVSNYFSKLSRRALWPPLHPHPSFLISGFALGSGLTIHPHFSSVSCPWLGASPSILWCSRPRFWFRLLIGNLVWPPKWMHHIYYLSIIGILNVKNESTISGISSTSRGSTPAYFWVNIVYKIFNPDGGTDNYW